VPFLNLEGRIERSEDEDRGEVTPCGQMTSFVLRYMIYAYV
jgi:hypothetical protein